MAHPIYKVFYNGTNVFPKDSKSEKGTRTKAFVEGRITVEKVIEEGQMFVEHPIFIYRSLTGLCE